MSDKRRGRRLYDDGRPLQSFQTRLLRLHPGTFSDPLICDLLTVDLIYFEGVVLRQYTGRDEVLTYEALSYVWGEPDLVKSMLCNSVDLPITENLFWALKYLRFSDKSRNLWVDAVCINQSDSTEKSMQVQNMLAIYMKAQRVLGWLGLEAESIATALRAIGGDLRAEDRHVHHKFPVSTRTYHGLKDLYERPWFRRIWVQQEIFAARELVLHCGKIIVDLEVLLKSPLETLRVLIDQNLMDPQLLYGRGDKGKLFVEGSAYFRVDKL